MLAGPDHTRRAACRFRDLIRRVPDRPEIDLLVSALLDAQARAPVGRTWLLNPPAHPALAELARHTTLCALQTFRPHARALRAAGIEPSAHMPEDGGPFDRIALFPTRNRLRNRFLIAAAMRLLSPRAAPPRLIACQANRQGARALEADLRQVAGAHLHVESRRKCRLLRLADAASLAPLPESWIGAGTPRRIEATGLFSLPGLFSWDRADPGSLLLLETVPELRGQVMDLCCGNGLLACRLVSAGHPVVRWHLLDAEALALDCARMNMADIGASAEYHWLDAAAETLPSGLEGRLDAVVCNPPFHRGHASDVGMGRRILRCGMRALRKGGRMFVVANRKLPYERDLAACAGRVLLLRQEKGYKIIEAAR
ncbi:MAG: methyltransferase [Mariprofundaceae bacterium]